MLVDAKVGDIGSTAERYAHMFFGELGADALTVNPYMGSDAVAPFLEYSTGALEASERCVFLICLTSNPGADDFETLPVDGCPLYRRVAEKAVEWSAIAPCGLVVGATRPQAIRGLRELAELGELELTELASKSGSGRPNYHAYHNLPCQARR
mgnify:CR=1 FL=1